MSLIWTLLGGVWARVIAVVVAVASVAGLVLGWRHSISKGARDEVRREIKERTAARIEAAHTVARNAARTSDSDILDKLRDHGWVR